jgi:hypothetical protein
LLADATASVGGPAGLAGAIGHATAAAGQAHLSGRANALKASATAAVRRPAGAARAVRHATDVAGRRSHVRRSIRPLERRGNSGSRSRRRVDLAPG